MKPGNTRGDHLSWYKPRAATHRKEASSAATAAASRAIRVTAAFEAIRDRSLSRSFITRAGNRMVAVKVLCAALACSVFVISSSPHLMLIFRTFVVFPSAVSATSTSPRPASERGMRMFA